jgi:hypothetical protein
MKPGLGARLRERLGPRWRQVWRRRREGEGRERQVDEIAADISTEELQEFLEGDLYPVQADPAFKEELRRTLWDLVQRTARRKGGEGPER